MKPQYWPLAVLAAGAVYLLLLQTLVPEGVYFNGDAGLKALLSQNIAAGKWGFDLDLPDAPWIKGLWIEGLFPYQKPFVYPLGEKYYITFPYSFSLVSAPFYALWGSRGLYLIPVLAAFITWVVFYQLCQKLEISPKATAAGLFVLIFSTHLSLYSAMYLELTLAVCLAFWGLSFLFPARGATRISLGAALAAGILTGLAVWFRPEQIFLVLFLDLVSLWSLVKQQGERSALRLPGLGKVADTTGRMGWVYIAASAITLLAYGLTNWLIYRNFFGVHAIQVLEEQTLLSRMVNAYHNLQSMTIGSYSLLAFFPVALFPILYGLACAILPGKVRCQRDWTIWYLFITGFLAGVAALVPPGAGGKQWGPRFLLLLAPMISLLFTWQLDHLMRETRSKAAKIGLTVVIFALAVVGVVQNPLRGWDFVADTYTPARSVVAKLWAKPQPVVAVSDQYLSQVFQPSVSREVLFFRVVDTNGLARLSEAMIDQGMDSFAYLCYSDDCKLFQSARDEQVLYRDEKKYLARAVSAETFEKYVVFNIQVEAVR